jgi:uncharacterized protein (DUF1800 family)
MPAQALTAIALNRFGLGARPGEDPPSDPAAWLEEQLTTETPRALRQTAAASILRTLFAVTGTKKAMEGFIRG